MRCSLPLAGREEPQIDMEMPFNSNAVPSNLIPSRSRVGRAKNWYTLASESKAAKSSTGVPMAWKAIFQSVTAVNFETRSPTPECQRISGAFKHTAVTIITPKGMADGKGRRRSPSVRLDCELQNLLFDSDAGTER